MANTNWEGGKEVQAAWFKFNAVGDGIKGTLTGKKLQKGTAPFPDQWVYELQTEDGPMNVPVSVNKKGTVQRMNSCKIGEIVGLLFEKEIPAATKGFAATKQLKVLSWGMDPNYSAMDGGQDVMAEGIDEM